MKKKNMIPIGEPSFDQEELDNVIKAVKDGWISSIGHFISEFEDNFARYIGVRYGVATCNGTTALHLALEALGIAQGDEVIIPALTFIATANAVVYTGAKPVLVDSHPDYWCLDPEALEKAITAKTKAIIMVHLYGHPCDIDPIVSIARRHNLFIIEDAAEAHGAEYRGRKTGSFGDISCYSFYGNKIITTGEGGMCLTDSEELNERMKILRDHGMNPNRRYWFEMIGFNYRMTNLQAAVGVAQLKKINLFINKKREIASWYKEGLKHLADGRGLLKLHPEMPWAQGVYWMYSILLEDGFGIDRDELMQTLGENGIDTRPLFYPLHVMPPYKDGHSRFPVAENIASRGLNLPSSVKLNREDVQRVCGAIEAAAK